MKLRVFETFSGIGAQHKALENIKIDYEIVGTSDWDINAIISYDAIHNGPITSKKALWVELQKLGIHTEEDIYIYLNKFIFSKDGKNPVDISKIKLDKLSRLCLANIRTKNLGSITDIAKKVTPPSCDLLTYSFPCQDLSIASMGRQKGMEKGSGTRSGLLWEIARILKWYKKENKMPKFLLLENVGNMISKKFKSSYDKWVSHL
ncbi:MAG: DNA cytosine methyltransferase, partial [Mycoplasmataceae bacterium]|nr:DNA cytosine methyltransferase [Mycoplasmataceae bacterium]